MHGKDIVHSGPLYDSMTVEDDKVRILFSHVGSGLMSGFELPFEFEKSEPPPLAQFLIAGKDRKFVPAQAKIDGKSVLVWSDQIKEPVAVRYAWACNPEGCNLYNKEGLPASPFRTDDWPWKYEPPTPKRP